MLDKKIKGLLLMGISLISVACGKDNKEEADTNLKVASHLPPMTEIVEIAAKNIEEPYTIQLIEVTDNVQYNDAVENKEAYASFAQHKPFMEQYNQANDGHLVALQTIYDPIVGFYSSVYDSIDEIEKGAEVALPSDAANEARALLILEKQGLIEIEKDINRAEVSIDHITNNPLDLTFTFVDLLNLTASYEDGIELVYNYPTYITNIGLTPDDALFLEDQEDTLFAITVVVHEENENDKATQALIDAFTSQEVYDYLVELSEVNHLYPAFDRPSDN